MGVWGGWAGVRHRNGPGWGGRWRRLVLRARVWNCDGEGSKAGQGCRRGGGLVNFPCELFVGIVNLLKQRLEPESDVGAREPDGAAGDGDRFRFYICKYFLSRKYATSICITQSMIPICVRSSCVLPVIKQCNGTYIFLGS